MDKRIPLDAFIAYLRLGRKYGITFLSKIAISKLALEFPITLQDRQHTIATSTIKNWPRFIDIRHTERGHYRVVNVLREHNALQHLPCALFVCSALDFSDQENKETWSLHSGKPSSDNDEMFL